MKCSRRVCDNENAICTHTMDQRMYCITCAKVINRNNPSHPGLIPIPMASMVMSDGQRCEGQIVREYDDYYIVVFTKNELEQQGWWPKDKVSLCTLVGTKKEWQHGF